MTRYALVLVALAGCLRGPEAPPPPRYVDLQFHVDPGFTPDERVQITIAAMDWSNFSSDHVRIALTDKPSDWQVVKLDGSEKIVADRDKECTSGMRVAGFFGGHTVFLIPSRMYGDQKLFRLAFHEIGHAIGLPHTPATGDAMSAVFVNTDPTENDKNLCRGYRLCP